MSFLINVRAFAKNRAKPTPVYRANPKSNFIKVAYEEIEAIKSGAESGKWFDKVNGEYIITLRNGIKVMDIEGAGKPQFVLESTENAISLLTSAINAAEQGEFDPIFAAQVATRKAA